MKKRTLTIIMVLFVVFLFSIIANAGVTPTERRHIQGNVKAFLKSNLKDPGSYQPIEWSPVVTVTKTSWVNIGYKNAIRHKYRARNSFGGYEIENQIFFIDAGYNVVDVMNY